MMRTPDGHGRLELSRFLTPPAVADHRNAPVNALGYLRVMFAVDEIDETLERLRNRGAQLVGEVVQYQDAYRLCYSTSLTVLGKVEHRDNRLAVIQLVCHEQRSSDQQANPPFLHQALSLCELTQWSVMKPAEVKPGSCRTTVTSP
jgi:hypothetical protein